jgi:hypothetical protein
VGGGADDGDDATAALVAALAAGGVGAALVAAAVVGAAAAVLWWRQRALRNARMTLQEKAAGVFGKVMSDPSLAALHNRCQSNPLFEDTWKTVPEWPPEAL